MAPWHLTAAEMDVEWDRLIRALEEIREVWALARQLERELAAANAENAKLREYLIELRKQMDYPGLPPAFVLTMKRMFDAAISKEEKDE